MNKSLNLRRYKRPDDLRIKKSFSIGVLNLFVKYVLSANFNVSRYGLLNLRKLMNNIDINEYTDNDEKINRIAIINKALEARLDYNLVNKDIIIAHVSGGLISEDELIVLVNSDISNEEIQWVNDSVSKVLQYAEIYSYADDLITLGTRIKTDIMSDELVDEFTELVTNASNDIRSVAAANNANNVFSLAEGSFEEGLTKTYNTLTSRNNKLSTGMIGFNALLKGGFEKSRTYLILGVTGGGKSLVLLNLAYQIKLNNKDYVTEDPTKIPTIVYMTMENNITETVNRLFQLSTGISDMTQFELDQVLSMARSEGKLDLNSKESGNIDIIVEYVPAKTKDTSYMMEMINRLESEGREVICFIQDHIKKINSSERGPKKELRLELGDILDQMKVIAADKRIPVITNSHLNRDANRKIEEAASVNKMEKVRLLNRDNIGESMLMLDNVDYCLAIAMEKLQDPNGGIGDKYMGFRLLKGRDGTGLDTDTIFQPFTEYDSIRLKMDSTLPYPDYKKSLLDIPQNNYNTGVENIRVSQYQINNIRDLNNIMNNNKSFEFTSE